MPDDTHDHEDDGYASETDDEHHRYDDDIVEDIEDNYKEDPLDSSSSYKYESDTESDSSGISLF